VVNHVDAAHVAVRVWRAAARRGCPLEVRVRFDDPWLNWPELLGASAVKVAEVFVLEPVTPPLVERLIRSGIAAGWRADSVVRPMRFVLDSDRERIHPLNE
jgi:hypothetical protein